MSAPTLEARIHNAFISLEHLIQTGQRLEVLKSHETQTDPKVLAIAVESVVGPGNRATATVSQAIKRTREAIARLVRWLIASIKDLVSNYRIRTERLHGFLNDVDNTVREGVRAGWLKGSAPNTSITYPWPVP